MGNLVGLDGKPLEGEIPVADTPEAVLSKLLDEIRAGTVQPIRLLVAVEGDAGFFNRSTKMTHSEAIALTNIANRLAVDSLLDV